MQLFRGVNLESHSTEIVRSVIILTKNQRLARPFSWHYSLRIATKLWKGFPGALSQVCTHHGKPFYEILFIHR